MNKDLEQTELKPSYNSIKTELNDDAISRQAVLDGLASIAKAKAKSDAQKSLMGRTMFFVEQLPSISTKKTGRWIKKKSMIYCSECCDGFDVFTLNDPFKYCPNCGAKMEVEE